MRNYERKLTRHDKYPFKQSINSLKLHLNNQSQLLHQIESSKSLPSFLHMIIKEYHIQILRGNFITQNNYSMKIYQTVKTNNHLLQISELNLPNQVRNSVIFFQIQIIKMYLIFMINWKLAKIKEAIINFKQDLF